MRIQPPSFAWRRQPAEFVGCELGAREWSASKLAAYKTKTKDHRGGNAYSRQQLVDDFAVLDDEFAAGRRESSGFCAGRFPI